jgi:Bacterial Ig-like domain (group 3)
VLTPALRRLALVIALPLALGVARGARPASAAISQTFTYTGAVQTFTVPAGVTSITITALGAGGARGSTAAGGTGAGQTGTFAVTGGVSLNVIVGGSGVFAGGGGGGGGGSFVYVTGAASPLIAAGGGGGGAAIGGGAAGGNGSNSSSGDTGGGALAGAGGSGGSGGGGSDFGGAGGGGGGYSGHGGDGGGPVAGGGGGRSVSNGAAGGGGAVCCNGGDGGFGGGGGSGFGGGGGGGGGGGFSGGGGGGGGDPGSGGGGGSFNSGTNPSSTAGSGSGQNGQVTITYTVASTTSLISTPNPSTIGQSVTFTATVSCTGFTPTGTVTFTIDGTPGSPQPLSGSPAQATLSTSSLAVGGHPATAAYSGDSNCAASTSNDVTQTVNLATTNTMLISAPNPSTSGQPATFSATVACTGFTPTGTVTFTIQGSPGSTVPLTGSTATFTTSSLPVGTRQAIAFYNGDGNCKNGTSNLIFFTVNAAGTTTTLASAPNPSISGQAVTFTSSVTCTGFTPTGTVTFTIDGSPGSPVTLVNGTSTFTTSTLTAGTHSVSASYSGDTNCAASTSSTLTQTVSQTGMTLMSSPNPSTPGQPVTFTATLTCPIALPSGTVTFFDNGSPTASLPLNIKAAPPVATFTTSTLAPGSHSITATYSGGGGCAAATSNIVTQVVGAAVYGVLLTSSANPSTPGQPVTFTATPTCPGFSPSGIVTFTIDGAVGTPVKLISGVASLTTSSSLTPGSHSVSAAYSGDGNCGPATSAVVTQMVGTAVSVPQPGDYSGSVKNCQALPAAEPQACFGQTPGNVGTSTPTPLPTPLPGSYCTMPDKSRVWVPQGATAPAGCT